MKAARLGWALLVIAMTPPGLGNPAVGSAQGAPRGSQHESFEEFFALFRQDSTFQLSRIRFPLPRFSQAEDSEQQLGRRTGSSSRSTPVRSRTRGCSTTS